MSTHNFNFDGGEMLTGMGASWFVSYAYYEKVDRAHRNWEKVSTSKTRISKYNQGRAYHKVWLIEVLSMNPVNLDKNTIGLNSKQTKDMAKAILERWKD